MTYVPKYKPLEPAPDEKAELDAIFRSLQTQAPTDVGDELAISADDDTMVR